MEGEEQKNENLEDELLEQEPPLAAAPVNANINQEQEKEQEDVVEEEEGIELGDTIMIEGGRLDRTRGRIYFMDDNLIRILPDGVSDSLKDIPLIDENPDPELGIEGIVILRKAPTHSFVHLLDIRPEQIVTTFTATGEPGPKFTVVSVDEEKDAILLMDETEATVEPIDPFVGIKRDMGFAVMRVNEPPKPVNVAVSEEPVEEQKEQEPLFEFLDEEIEVPQVVEITEIPTFLRNYPDAQQKTDMLQDLLKALDPSSQKNPRRVREARILTEVLFHLRNSLVEYTRAGDAKKEPKETSFKTLADLLKKSKFPLARPIVQTQRVLNLDHSAEHFSKKQASSDPTEIADPQIQIRYLDDVVKAEINYVENQLGNPTDKDHDAMRLGAGSGGGLPRWYVGWQGFFDSYLQTLPPSGDAKESVTHDNDVFRSEVPVLTRKESQLSGLPPLKDIVEGKMAEAIVDKDFIGKVTFSDLRALGPSYQRYGEKGTVGISENSDEITVLNYLLFPLTYMREFGSTRSGKLAMDMAESITPAETKGSIIWNDGNGLIGEVPTPGSILVIKPDGSSLGNVSVADWLDGQPVYGGGMGDIIPLLRSFGLTEREFTVDQMEVLNKKITQYRAAVKQFLNGEREIAAKVAADQTVQVDQLLQKDTIQLFFDRIANEVVLNDALIQFGQRFPFYKESDVARFSALYKPYQDLLLTVLAGIPEPIVRERNRVVKDQFLEALKAAIALQKKKKEAGEPPKPNPCPHVASLDAVKKIRNDRAAEKQKLMIKILNDFRGDKKDHWIWCIACKQHLICEHDFLLLQEYLHPREKDVIHKEILLAFSDGQSGGKYVCRNCGEGISNVDYDTHLEYDDEGRPMSGRAVLEDKDARRQEEIDQMLGDPAVKEDEEELNFDSEDKKLIYFTLKELADLVGIFPDGAAYHTMINRVQAEVLSKPSRKQYTEIQKAQAKLRKGTQIDYDVFINRFMVGCAASVLLINIQTHIPDYTRRYTLQGCKNPDFKGYPMDRPENKTGIEYMSCAVASVSRNKSPWNLTGFQSIRSDVERQKGIARYIEAIVKELATKTDVQKEIIDKKQYLQETFGAEAAEGRPRDIIPDGFTPMQVVVPKVAAASEPVVAAAANGAAGATAWILEGHKLAREHGILVPGSPMIETTCCYDNLTAPGKFWKAHSMPGLKEKEPPRGTRGSILRVPMAPRELVTYYPKADESVMYRLFIRVCFKGDRIGLPHEMGYNLTCPHCGLVFPEDTRVASDDKEQKQVAEQNALQQQGIIINKESFDELLDAVHKRYKFTVDTTRKRPVVGVDFVESFLTMNPLPIDDFAEVVLGTVVALRELEKKDKATATEYANAYGPLSNKVVLLESVLQRRLGQDRFDLLQRIMTMNPRQLGETVRSYFLIPFQRIISNLTLDSLTSIQKSYELSPETVDDAAKLIESHIEITKKFVGKVKPKTFAFAKLVEAVQKLKAVLPVLMRSLRSNTVPGGKVGFPYLVKILLYGVFAELLDPNHVPDAFENEVVAAGSILESESQVVLQFFAALLMKIKAEGLDFSSEQIKQMIEDNAEQEKTTIIKKLDAMSRERKQVELLNKKLGLGDWAVGGTKKIREYDPDQYMKEKEQRAVAAAAAEINDGVDVVQEREDDA
jgi:hypothetical protein